jgi:uncharacterized coiled-coil protein SlyX
MIDNSIYENILSTLDKDIADQKMQVEKLMLEAKSNGVDTSEIEKLNELTISVQTALQNKDVNALNQILANANSINK